MRPGGMEIGTVKFPVPVKRSGEKVSPIPVRAPPPLGVEIMDSPELVEVIRMGAYKKNDQLRFPKY